MSCLVYMSMVYAVRVSQEVRCGTWKGKGLIRKVEASRSNFQVMSCLVYMSMVYAIWMCQEVRCGTQKGIVTREMESRRSGIHVVYCLV